MMILTHEQYTGKYEVLSIHNQPRCRLSWPSLSRRSSTLHRSANVSKKIERIYEYNMQYDMLNSCLQWPGSYRFCNCYEIRILERSPNVLILYKSYF